MYHNILDTVTSVSREVILLKSSLIVAAGCILVVAAVLAPSVLFHCVSGALRVAIPAMLSGCLLGACMALITRIRRPAVIYASLLIGIATAWPLIHPWPAIRLEDVVSAEGSIQRAIMYLETIRPLAFLAGVPIFYIGLGQHSADVIASDSTGEGPSSGG